MGAEEKKTTSRVNMPTESWSEIVREHQRYIYNLAYNLCHNRDDADDLTQEVFWAGYYKAFLLPANMCTLCNSCSSNRTGCKNPIVSRPCAEAVGIDVYAVAREMGYPIEVLRDYNQTMNRYAFILVE